MDGKSKTANQGSRSSILDPRPVLYPFVSTSADRAHPSASPSKLKLISAKKINNPGRKTCSGAMKIFVAALVSKLPQLGVGG